MSEGPFQLKKIDLGWTHTLTNNKATIFFGNTSATLQKIKDYFKFRHSVLLKQVHGNQVLDHSSKENLPADKTLSADGHRTSQKNLALLILTADCIPFLFCKKDGTHCGALHAGWRGVEQRIIPAALQSLDLAEYHFWIGPHIRKQSFEVGKDVAERLLLSTKLDAKDAILNHTDLNKRRVDLDFIVRKQLEEFRITESQITSIDIDTFTNEELASFRRKPIDTGRNISFVSLN